jgi:alpha-glucosidase
VLELDPRFILNLDKLLIVVRRHYTSLTEVAYEPITTEGQLLAFARVHDGERLLVAANFGTEPVSIPAVILPPSAIVLMSTHLVD